MKTKGFSLIELIVYIAVLLIISTVLVNSFIIVMRAFNGAQLANRISTEGSTVLERATREIRNAESVDTLNSTFGSNPGTLVLNTTNSSGDPATITLWSDGNTIYIEETDGGQSRVTSPRISADTFIVNHTAGDTSAAVTIDLDISATKGNTTRSKAFRTSAVTRGLY